MQESKESSKVFLNCEMAVIPNKMFELGIQDKIRDIDSKIGSITREELMQLLKANGFEMREGKSKPHYEMEGKEPETHPDLVKMVMDKGYSEHPLFYKDEKIGSIYINKM